MEKDETNLHLKTRLSEVLAVLDLIIIIYGIFIAILGIVISNTEAIIEACIIAVVYIIFEYLNSDVTKINSKGIKNSKYGYIDWKKIYRVQRKDNLILLYTKEKKKPYKIFVTKAEDPMEISRAYKYILSKIKSSEKIK